MSQPTKEQREKVRQIINENIAASNPLVTVWITNKGLDELFEFLRKEGYEQD